MFNVKCLILTLSLEYQNIVVKVNLALVKDKSINLLSYKTFENRRKLTPVTVAKISLLYDFTSKQVAK